MHNMQSTNWHRRQAAIFQCLRRKILRTQTCFSMFAAVWYPILFGFCQGKGVRRRSNKGDMGKATGKCDRNQAENPPCVFSLVPYTQAKQNDRFDWKSDSLSFTCHNLKPSGPLVKRFHFLCSCSADLSAMW